MHKVKMWMSFDGELFYKEEECRTYEIQQQVTDKLYTLLSEEFCFAPGYAQPEEISEYIIKNLDKLGLDL